MLYKYYNYKNIKAISQSNDYYKFKFNLIVIFAFLLSVFAYYKYYLNKEKLCFFLEKYEVNIYHQIREKLLQSKCSIMFEFQREFLNGIIRKFKPHKILELGVQYGGSSIIIMNAIEDIKDSKLYSIDINNEKKVGICVYKYFPQFLNNWNLFKGDCSTEYLEQIGNNIDMVFIDTAHFEPGEILDFLIVLPFLKEEAIVIIHDIASQMTTGYKRNEWAPYIIFNAIRGEKFFPSGNFILKQGIGAAKLEKSQHKFYNDYFRLLGGQWQYFPKEIYINKIRNFFKKYYEQDCLMIFEETVSFNRNLVKLDPKPIEYRYISD